jgi:hypothetical protein
MKLKELKHLAIQRGIKQKNVGWSTCCPGTGNMPDIIKALKEHDAKTAAAAAPAPASTTPATAPRRASFGAAAPAAALASWLVADPNAKPWVGRLLHQASHFFHATRWENLVHPEPGMLAMKPVPGVRVTGEFALR